MIAHPLAFSFAICRHRLEIGVDKNTTVVFPGPLMSTIQEMGAFLSRETGAAAKLVESFGLRSGVETGSGERSPTFICRGFPECLIWDTRRTDREVASTTTPSCTSCSPAGSHAAHAPPSQGEVRGCERAELSAPTSAPFHSFVRDVALRAGRARVPSMLSCQPIVKYLCKCGEQGSKHAGELIVAPFLTTRHRANSFSPSISGSTLFALGASPSVPWAEQSTTARARRAREDPEIRHRRSIR